MGKTSGNQQYALCTYIYIYTHHIKYSKRIYWKPLGSQVEVQTKVFNFLSLFWGNRGAAPHDMRNLSSPTRDWPFAPTLKAQSLNHWTTREVSFIFNLYTLLCTVRDFLQVHILSFIIEQINTAMRSKNVRKDSTALNVLVHKRARHLWGNPK